MYSLATPMPGGSTYHIRYDNECIDINIPPVGYTIDRIPNPDTGKPSYELVKCEILFADKKTTAQRWHRTELPKDWDKWRKEERERRKTMPTYVNSKAEQFRKQQWLRRINGVWMAIWDPVNEKTEHVYLTGFGLFYHNWWRQDFGYPKFRFVYLKVYYGLQYAEDHQRIHGVTMSTNRRFGKSSIAYGWQFEFCSRTYNAYGGSQAQTKVDAKKKWDTNMMFGWKRIPDFFRPVYDYNNTNELKFKKPLTKYSDELSVVDEQTELGGIINFRETKSTSYDGEKIHRGIVEEPGKWIEEDIYKTIRVLIPCTIELGSDEKIGLLFAPTTIEDLKSGGYEFIDLFEDSFPSLMARNEDGKTTSGLIAIFIPAYEGYLFDEYGRSIIDDPPPGIIVYDEKGKPLKQAIGARNLILKGRKKYENDRQKYAEIVRKFPFTWSEAKMMADQESPFNLEILQKRLNELSAMPRNLFIKGNFSFINGIKDGDVEFVRDDLGGRWAIGQGAFDLFNENVFNRVGVDYRDGQRLFYPKNDKMFAIGADPIQFTRNDDARNSKAAAYIFYKLDINDLVNSNNFIGQYLYRPDEPSVFCEDIVLACRYFGCSVLAEYNIKSLYQYLTETRKEYTLFHAMKGQFDRNTIMQESPSDAWKGISTNPEVLDSGIGKLVSMVLRNGHRFIFPELIEQLIQFTIKDRSKFDAVMAALYTMLAIEKRVEIHEDDYQDVQKLSYGLMYAQSGNKSQAVATAEMEDEFDSYEND